MSETADTDPRPPAKWAALAALGVVYGDLGTSPLYTLQTVSESLGGRFTSEAALGVLSLIVWTLIITVSVKYSVLAMRADNHGEGGILALMSLVGANSLAGRTWILAAMGLLGAALIYGDGVITPSISVLSAIEGITVATRSVAGWVMPIAGAILVVFFAVQRFGTAKIGGAFGPIMLAWFVVIGLLGIGGIVRHPAVLSAVDPRHAIGFLAHGGSTGFLVLGGVFLCITGAEALYADMGHFGAGPIRLSWYAVVLPALLLNYAGQTGWLIGKGEIHGNPFFQIAPRWSIYPLVALATVATVIASQAIVSGVFSMTRQAMQLGWLPGFAVRQTSDEVYGQIYVPMVNWLMMLATLGVTIAFRSSDRLAGAYGTAVSTTMLLTTALLFVAMRKVWRWPLAACVLVAGGFLIVDLGFFGANLLKIADGGWLPLTLGAMVFAIMLTWRWGIEAVHAETLHAAQEPQKFLADLDAGRTPRVPGVGIFLSRIDRLIPPLMIDQVKHMGALHECAIALTIIFEETPRIPGAERGSVECIADGLWRVVLRFGFVETPDLCRALKALTGLDPAIDVDKAVFFASRDIVAGECKGGLLAHVRTPLFAFLYRNAVRAVDRFRLPSAEVVEIAREIVL